MKHYLFAGIALAALGATVSAQAADLPNRKQAPAMAPVYSAAPAFSWTGFYVGANTGWGTGSFTKGSKTLFGSPSGGMLGLTAGYNYQAGQFVAGLEGDFDKSWAKSSSTFAGPPAGNGRGYLTSVGSVRGRLGYAADRALIYGTGGLAFGTVKASLTDTTNALSLNQNRTEAGYALGAGLEYAFTNNISAKAEYLYTALGAKNFYSGTADATKVGLNYSTIKAGINYHF